MERTSKNKVFPLVAGAVLLVTGLVSGVTVYGQNQTLSTQRTQLEHLTSQVAAATSGTRDLNTAVSMQASGANAARVAADTKTIGTLVARALTWSSNAEYTAARTSTMRVYGLSADSAFMKSFLPVAPVTTDSKGNQYSYIDAAGLNSSVPDFKVKVLSVNGISYRYMALVDVQAKSSDGIGTAVNVATVFATIDGQGKLTDISGFAATTKPRISG